ncbi:MAG TPA: CHRD domain-containing protein [Gemmatimonadaceae bacterium]|nr:CHRD domain-containing protein [Gemmatimonadaceae bacterium]
MSRKNLALGAAAALLVGCTADKPAPTAVEMRVPLFVSAAKGGNGDFNLGTHMTGAEEVFTPVPPSTATPADSRGQGEAIFRVSGDGSSVDFQLVASNVDNVIMSHIHCGRPGENGPIRMWLYPVIGPTGAQGPNGSGPQNGVLASGTFAPAGVVCPASAVGVDMPLLDAMRAGLTYVNVHTNDGVAPANTGPGDFPGGEIRGQLDHGR